LPLTLRDRLLYLGGVLLRRLRRGGVAERPLDSDLYLSLLFRLSRRRRGVFDLRRGDVDLRRGVTDLRPCPVPA